MRVTKRYWLVYALPNRRARVHIGTTWHDTAILEFGRDRSECCTSACATSSAATDDGHHKRTTDTTDDGHRKRYELN